MAYKQKSPIAILEGGTNTQSFVHAFGVAYYDGGSLNNIDPGTANYVLTSNGSSAPSFQIASASGSITSVAGNSGSATPSSGVLTISGDGTILSTSGSGSTLSLTSTAVHTIGSSSGTATASSNAISFVGATGISTSASGSTVTITGTATSITLAGNTGSISGSSFTLSGSGDVSTSASGSTLTIAGSGATSLISGSGTATVSSNAFTIAGGTGITTSASGATVTITASGGGGGFTWNNTTGSTQAMSVGNGYVSNDGATLVTFTLPSTAAVGSLVAVQGAGSGLWTIAQNSGQTIAFNAVTSTSGATGSVSSTSQFDSITLICITTNSGWAVNQSTGNLSVV